MKLFKYLTSMVLIAGLAMSCQEEDQEFGTILAPKALEVSATLVGADADNPFGDGSGEVIFTANAYGALSYKFVVNNFEKVAPSGTYTHIFSTLGVNSYEVVVLAFGAGGTTTSEVITVEVRADYSPPQDLLDLLTNGGSRTMRIEAETWGHMGVGPATQVWPEWYGAGPYEKDFTALYDDRYIFNIDGSVTLDTGEDASVFGQATPLNQTFGDLGLTPNSNNEFEYYPLADITGQWMLTAPGGNEKLTVTNNTFLGFFVGGSQEYDILYRDATALHLRTIGADGNGWFFIITIE
mgnify:CR=1 FL=1